MSRESYFRKFPLINYSNTLTVNITRRAVIPERVRANRFSYYPYTIREYERADHISDAYYGDPYFEWLVWTGAGIIDPYHDWYLDGETFESYLRSKYGSIEASQEKILWWQVDWADVEEKLSVAAFNSLPEALMKYYQADYGQGTRVISYYRTKEDWMTTTNMLVRFDIEESNTSFVVGENVRLRIGNTDHANGIVAWSNSSQVKIQHVFGNVDTANATLVGLESGANAVVTQFYYESNCIPVDERVYWEPVYAYEYETGINEANKIIKIIDSKYKLEIGDDMTKKLNE